MNVEASAPQTSRLGSRWRWLVALCILLCLSIGGVIGLRRVIRHSSNTVVAIPSVQVEGLDPEIARTIERAQSATRLTPFSPAAWGTLGAVLFAHKFHKEALSCFVEAERLQPKEPRWPYLQGIILLSWDPDSAIPKLERAAQLFDKESAPPRLRLAHLLVERGRLDQAEKDLRALLQRYPDEPHALLGLGKVLLARGRLPEALALLERAARSPQTQRASTALIATIQQRLGNGPAAEEAARRVAMLPADPPLSDPVLDAVFGLQAGMQTRLTRADRLRKSGQLAEALTLFEKTVATYPDAAIAWQLLGQARIEAKNYAAAEKALLRAVELAPDAAEAHFQLGSVYFLQEKIEKAISSFRRSITLRPNHAPGHFNLGIALSRAGQQTEAIEAFREAIRLAPNFADAHRWVGGTLALERRFEEAVEALRRAVELNPADQTAATMLERATQRVKEKREKEQEENRDCTNVEGHFQDGRHVWKTAAPQNKTLNHRA